MTTFTSGAVLALTLDQDDRLTFVGSGSCTVTPTYGSSWVIRLDAPGTVIGPFRQNVSLSITTTRDGSYTTDNYGDQPTYVTASTNSVTGGISLSVGYRAFRAEDLTRVFERPPTVFDNLSSGYSTASYWQYMGTVYQPTYSAADSATWAPLQVNSAAPTDIMTAASTKFAGGVVSMLKGFTGSAIDVAITVGGLYQIFTISILATGELDNVALASAMALADANTYAQVLKIYDQSGAGNHCALGTATGVPCVLNGTIATNQLTGTVSSGTTAVGQFVFGAGVTAGTTISSGAASPWTLSTTSTVGVATNYYLGAYNPPYIDFDPVLGRYVIFTPSTATKRVLQFPQTMTITSGQNMGVLALGRGVTSGDLTTAAMMAVGDQSVGTTKVIVIQAGSSYATCGQLKTYNTDTGSATYPVALDVQPSAMLFSCSASSAIFNVNGATASAAARAATAYAGGWLFSLSPAVAAYTGMFRFVGVSVFNSCPTATQQTLLMASSIARINAVPQVKNTVFCVGDSRIVNRFLNKGVGIPDFLARAIGRAWRVVNVGVQSSTVAQQIGDGLVPTVTGLAASLNTLKSSGKNYAVILIGVNDFGIGSATVSTVFTNIQTMCNQLVSVGIAPIVIPELATTSTAGSNPSTQLQVLRSLINAAGESGMNASAIVDVSSFVPVVTPSNTTYYSDGLHPTESLDQAIASAVSVVII